MQPFALVDDVGVSAVKVPGDLSGRAVGFDADQITAGWCCADEVAGSTAGFEDPAPLEAQLMDGSPSGVRDLERGVVGVEGAAPRLGPGGLAAQEATDLCPGRGLAVASLVEDLGEAPPTRPSGEDGLVSGRRASMAKPLEQCKRLDVCPELCR